VKMGTTAAQKKLFFNLRRLKGQMQAIEEGDLKPEQVTKVADMLGVPEADVVSMNHRLAAPDQSLNARFCQASCQSALPVRLACLRVESRPAGNWSDRVVG
jgi:RNA polymerase sigma-32 factor